MKEKRGKNRSGQMNLSFGMIFSIILIIVFLVFGFYAIKKIIEFQQSVQIEQFIDNFQNDIDTMWKSPQGSKSVTYSLPSKINSICFINDDAIFEKLRITSKNVIPGEKINHIDVEKITEKENPFCIENNEGKIQMVISKSFGETLVTITE
jgi:hypothetical protein